VRCHGALGRHEGPQQIGRIDGPDVLELHDLRQDLGVTGSGIGGAADNGLEGDLGHPFPRDDPIEIPRAHGREPIDIQDSEQHVERVIGGDLPHGLNRHLPTSNVRSEHIVEPDDLGHGLDDDFDVGIVEVQDDRPRGGRRRWGRRDIEHPTRGSLGGWFGRRERCGWGRRCPGTLRLGRERRGSRGRRRGCLSAHIHPRRLGGGRRRHGGARGQEENKRHDSGLEAHGGIPRHRRRMDQSSPDGAGVLFAAERPAGSSGSAGAPGTRYPATVSVESRSGESPAPFTRIFRSLIVRSFGA
jgi:hypothetical protein